MDGGSSGKSVVSRGRVLRELKNNNGRGKGTVKREGVRGAFGFLPGGFAGKKEEIWWEGV